MKLIWKTALAASFLAMALSNNAALAADHSARAFIDRFHQALFSEDMATVSASFTADAIIFESGKREPSLEAYLEHHLGPELPMLAGLTRDVEVEELVEVGGIAWYGVQAQLHGLAGERQVSITHATTIVVARGKDGWKIMQIHFSNRRNKPAAAKPAE